MEYLQGRSLTNAIGNLGIQDAYGDALKKLGHQLEEITEQVVLFFFFSSSTYAFNGKRIPIELFCGASVHVIYWLWLILGSKDIWECDPFLCCSCGD